ncbi:MAG: energy-coupling factor ABC transporter permease [Kiritimatiellia bacterium]|nr:energy-coupling factor ABC transporter permease [Kiritimatiellia bacterium]
MHIPDAMLQGRICPITAALAAVGLVAASVMARRARVQPSASRFAAVTSLVFAAQMLNFPIAQGTSGHLLGGVLSSVLLGTPLGILSIAWVVVLQSLVFSDGGWTVLGANVFNMALIGAGVGGFLRSRLATRWAQPYGESAATAVAAWVSVLLAALSVSVQLALDGQIAFSLVLPAMLSAHARIGVGEAVFTGLACFALASKSADAKSGWRGVALPLSGAVLAGGMLSPFASGWPDGLEFVAEKLAFLSESSPARGSPMPDYTVPFVSFPALSTALAGLMGVAITFAIAWIWNRITIPASVRTHDL